MHNINLQGPLRSVSIVIISLVVFLYIGLNILFDDIILESSNSQSRKEYEYRDSAKGTSIPGFTYNLESLFLKELIPVIAAAEIVTELVSPVAPPLLQFVGMIETNEATIYSFRNMDTNRLLLLEEGMSIDGITLLAIERSPAGIGREEVFIIKIQDHTFQVDKK
ncbi:MAG: hypothetical protein KAR21_06210 [Spirochaetales bacterium]|nr:hypothetical protein [Spirochaetales bacterium]